MNPISVSQLSTREWDFVEDLQNFQDAGIGGIGLWRQKLQDWDLAEAAELLAESGLRPSSLSWAGGFTGSDGRSYEDAVEDGFDAIHEAAYLGARCLIVHPGAKSMHTHTHAFRLVRQALAELVPFALDHGVRLTVVPMCGTHSSGWTFIKSIRRALELCAPFPVEALGIALNLFHWGRNLQCLAEFNPRELVRRTALVQVAQACRGRQGQRTLLGAGTIPLERWVFQLKQWGYRGFFEAELYSPEIQSISYPRRLENVSQFFQESLAGVSFREVSER